MARNSDGKETLGVAANDRVTSYSELMREDRTSRRKPLQPPTGGLDWPAWLAISERPNAVHVRIFRTITYRTYGRTVLK